MWDPQTAQKANHNEASETAVSDAPLWLALGPLPRPSWNHLEPPDGLKEASKDPKTAPRPT